MRIGLIGPVPPELGGATPGGVATHQAALASGLSRLGGVEVSLLATNARCVTDSLPYTVVPNGDESILTARALRYALRLTRRRLNGSRRQQLKNLLSYSRFLRKARPDVVHVQHPLERLWYTNEVTRLEGRTWPLVVTAHSFFGEHEEAVIHGFMAPNLRTAARVIAVSPHIADQAVQLGVERQRIRTIRSGIDTEQYQPRPRPAARARLGVADEAPLVLFVGNLEPRKQLDVLLRALAKVPAPKVAIVGDGDERARLGDLAHQLGVANRVQWVGRVSADALLDWYAAADVFALPSSSEAQGIVALEAMACGLPVVASAVGGLHGTIEDGIDGFLVPAGQVEPLAARLNELIRDPLLRGRIGGAARGSVIERFSWTSTVQATADVYRELLEEACPTR